MHHKFVEFIPERLDSDTLYISLDYGTAVHLCACGCGNEIVTPISPADWSIMYDGMVVSLSPSIGNWSYPCRSHYYLWKGRVEWAQSWSEDQIKAGRKRDMEDRQRMFRRGSPITAPIASQPEKADGTASPSGFRKMIARIQRLLT